MIAECWGVIGEELHATYTVTYPDTEHPGRDITITSELPYGETDLIYLPEGIHPIEWVLSDRCGNHTYFTEDIPIIDNNPPVPVCDEITQVTLNPDECWARVYARDLDDGSNDNCCDQLHFAVAHMDSVEYYRQYWWNQFETCAQYSYDNREVAEDLYGAIVESWLNCYVFDEYIDVSGCGVDSVILRVYEYCEFPPYDPHNIPGEST